ELSTARHLQDRECPDQASPRQVTAGGSAMIRLLLTSGRGPGECRIALVNTLGEMAREAEAAGLELDVAAGPDPDGHGPASAIVLVQGPGAEAFAATWVGSILWVARSPIRSQHKRKNWFVGIF